MRILVTRPECEAQSFARILETHGHEALLAPMLRVLRLPVPEGLADRLAVAQAILLTSLNGARAMAEATRVRGYRIIAVGDATADAARQAGFTHVNSASGDARALVAYVTEHLDPSGGPLMHVGGVVRAGDIAGALRTAGFSVGEVALYETQEADSLPGEIERAICDGRLDAVTFFSPRTAAVFVKLARQAGVALHLARVTAVAISPAALAATDGIPWRARVAARVPTQAGVLAALDAVTPSAAEPPSMSDDSKPTDAGTPDDGKREPARPVSDTTPEPAADISPATAPRRGVGVLGAFVIGLAAAVVVLVGASAVYMAQPEAIRQLFRSTAGPGDASVSREVLAAALKPLDERVAQLEAKAQAIERVSAQATQLKGLQEQVAEQEKRLATLQDLAAKVESLPQGGSPDLPQLREQLVALRTELGALSRRQEATESAMAALRSGTPSTPGTGTADLPADVGRRLAALTERLDLLEKRDAQVSSALSGAVDGAALARAVSEAEARLRDQLARNTADIERARDAASKLGERIAAVEKDVATKIEAVRNDVAARMDSERRADPKDRAAAAIGVATRLRYAIESGEPFVADAELLKPLGANDPAIAAIHGELAPLASAGVPTRRDLAAAFPEMARRVLAADVADDSWWERLLGRLRQLVSIRRVGDDVAGATPEAILARAEAAVNAGAVARAVDELKRLKDPAAAPARDWLARAETHLAAQRAVDRLSLHGIGQLSQAPSR